MNHKVINYFLIILCIFIFLVLSGSYLPWIIVEEDIFSQDDAAGSLYRKIGYSVLYLVVSIILITEQNKLIFKKKVLIVILFWFFFTMLAFSSCLWSVNFWLTFRRSIAFLGTGLIGYFFYKIFTYNQFISLLYYSTFFYILVNLIIILFFPTLGIFQEGTHLGKWRGIFPTQHLLARSSLLLSIVSINLFLISEKYLVKILNFLVISFLWFLIVFSYAKTYWVTLVVVLYFLFLLWLVRQYGKKGITLGLFLIVLTIFVVVGYYSFFLDVINRDLTLTGRTRIFSAVFRDISKRPFLGYGYTAYWDTYVPKLGAMKWYNHPFLPKHAHNGFLNVLINFGLLGFIIFIIFYIFITYNSLQLFFNKDGMEEKLLIPVLFFVSTFTFNFADSHLIDHNYIIWPLILYFSCHVIKARNL